jgi:hypothetical protein
VPVDVEPPELARLLDFAERPRVDDWSLRAALVRYAQPEPARVAQILELVRRIDAALGTHRARLESEGDAIWAAVVDDSAAANSPDATLVGLLGTAAQIDRLGDLLATWAVERAGDRPDAEVDAVITDVTGALDALGIPREERTAPPRRRG